MKKLILLVAFGVWCLPLTAGWTPAQLRQAKPAVASAPGPITFVAATTNNFSATSVTMDVPPGTQSGDALIMVIASDAAHTVNSQPTGFAIITNNSLGSAGFTVSVKVADGTEAATLDWGFSATVAGVSLLLCYENVNAAPFEAQASDQAFATGTISTPALLPAQDDSMLLGIFWTDPPSGAVTFTEVAGFPIKGTVLRDANAALCVTDRLQTTATSEGSQTTVDITVTWARYTLVLKP